MALLDAPVTSNATSPLRHLTKVCWFLLGAVFIFSGLIKLNDPVGTGLKLEEYFEVFALDLPPLAWFFLFLKKAARTFAILISSLEVILGVALLLRWHLRKTLWVLLGLLVFFAFLTFYSAAFNKVTDCGCFGDFIKLTPWTSFFKDMFLLLLWTVVFINQRFLRRALVQGTMGIMTMTFAAAIAIGIGVRALGHLPYIDFLPYKVGNDIGKLMKPQEAAVYQYTMERNGETKIFSEYPTDSTWVYKSMQVMNPEKSKPVITDFRVWNDEGDYTQEILKGNKLILVVMNTDKADRDRISLINKLFADAEKSKRGIESLIITSSSPAEFDVFRHTSNFAVPYYFADATVLKSMIRSNPGFIILKDGVVKGKYHYHDIPSIGKVEEKL
ncbi:DoxX family protein [Hymenobacter saemangeumensis]|uniref:DoxX family protein n=1 Tax=Hymenobacter saemangeumensis TaxID=1084522 RepID=A0ABP8IDQ6_9BACT